MDFHSVDARRNPYPLYAHARVVSPVLYNPETDFWMIFGYDGVTRVLSELETFSSDLSTSAGQPAPQWMIFFDPPRHTKLRALVALAFTRQAVTSIEPRVSGSRLNFSIPQCRAA